MNKYSIHLLLFCTLALPACKIHSQENTNLLHLSTANKIIQLTGQFKFRAADHSDFSSTEYDDSDWQRIQVPAQWLNIGIRNAGVGWYRIGFTLNEDNQDDLAVMMPYTLASHEVYVNGKLLGGRGIIGETDASTKYNIQVCVYRIPAVLLKEKNILAIRVQPYAFVGGIALPDFYLGYSEIVNERYSSYLIWNSFLVGVSLIMAIYFLIQYLFANAESSNLFFSMLAILATTFTLGSKTIDYWIIDSFYIHESLIQIPVALMPYFAIRFMETYFSIRAHRLMRILAYLNMAMLLVFFAGAIWPAFYTFHLAYLFQIQTIIISLVVLYLIWRNIQLIGSGIFGTRTILIGFICQALAMINDAISNSVIFYSERLYEEGFVTLILAMAIAQGMRWNHSLRLSDKINIELDHKVQARTQELKDALQNAELARKEVEKLNEFNRKINETTDLNIIVDHIIHYIHENYGLDGTMLHLLDRQKQEFKFFKVVGRDHHTPEQYHFASKIVFPMDERGGMIWQLIKKQRSMYFPRFPDIKDPDDPIIRIRRAIGFTSGMIVPLVILGEVIGIIFFTKYTGKSSLTKLQVKSIKRFCDQIAGAVYGGFLLKQIKEESEKSDSLLLNILPAEVATELKEHGQIEPLNYDSVTVLFTDFVGFTKIAENMLPRDLVNELDGCFTQFDEIATHYGLEKLKTIGDAYMCAGGLPARNQTNPVDACLAALEFRAFVIQMQELKQQIGLSYWSLRIGLHTGAVTAGVVGKNKFAYDIWGDTVNTASRMESAGVPGEINISEAMFRKVNNFFICTTRETIEVKGKGKMKMYFLKSIRPELASPDNARIPGTEFQKLYNDLKKSSPQTLQS